jgi:hypothetical protein
LSSSGAHDGMVSLTRLLVTRLRMLPPALMTRSSVSPLSGVRAKTNFRPPGAQSGKTSLTRLPLLCVSRVRPEPSGSIV